MTKTQLSHIARIYPIRFLFCAIVIALPLLLPMYCQAELIIMYVQSLSAPVLFQAGVTGSCIVFFTALAFV